MGSFLSRSQSLANTTSSGFLGGGKSLEETSGYANNTGPGKPVLALSKAIGSIGGVFMNAWGHGTGRKVSPGIEVDNDTEHVLVASGNDANQNIRIVRNPMDHLNTFRSMDGSGRNSVTCVEIHNNAHTMNCIGELEIQKPAPQWKGTAVVDGVFTEISLEDYKDKYLVFFFYPLDFTFVCPTEIIAFSDRVDEFRAIGCEVVACSTDSHFCHFAWVSQPRKQGGLGPMNIPLLADKTGEISKAYGVFKKDSGIAFRGLFIIDPKQNLRQITINDLPVGRSVDETLRLVQAFQFTDKNGEVCPAGWKPGQKSIKPTVGDSKEYFEGT